MQQYIYASLGRWEVFLGRDRSRSINSTFAAVREIDGVTLRVGLTVLTLSRREGA